MIGKASKKALKISILSLSLAGALSATPAFAVDCTKEYCALTTIPGATTGCTSDANGVVTCLKTTDPVGVVKNIYGISIGIAAVLAVVMIIWAGIEYATVESITGHSDAKEKWQGAIWGLVLLLSSYLILRTINIDLVKINLDLGKPAANLTGSVNNDVFASIALQTQKTAADATAANQAAQQVAKTAEQNIQSQIDLLNVKIKDPNLSPADKVQAQKDLDYANVVLSSRKFDQTYLQQILDINANIASGKPASVADLKSGIDDQIAKLNAAKKPDDAKISNDIDTMIASLNQKKKDVAVAQQTISNQNAIYARATGLYADAIPSRAGMTVDEFQRELVGKTMYSGDIKDSPINILNSQSTTANISNPDVGSIVKTYTAGYVKNVNSSIQNRVTCYQISTKQGAAAATSAGCKPFSG